MIVFFIILFFVSLYGVKFSPYNKDYFSRESTNSVKGILAIAILLYHMPGYISYPDNLFNNTYDIILRFLGQLVVAPYFFFSGFGIMETIKRNPNYSKTFPKKSILRTLLHFDIAVLIYLAASIIMNAHFRMNQYILCWIGWESIEGGHSGNTNWFVFVILVQYVLTYISILVRREEKWTWYGKSVY